MVTHLDISDGRYAEAAAAILRRHDNFEAEANITTAVRDFLILTGLAVGDEIIEENPPSDASRRAVDLTALDTFIEFKRRIGVGALRYARGAPAAAQGERRGVAQGERRGVPDPDPVNVAQLDEYLELSKSAGKGVRTGILTDGRYWLLRWPEAGPVRTAPPYGFALESADQWLPLYEWLRDRALLSLDRIPADRANVEQYLGPGSPAYQRDIDALARRYGDAAQYETVQVKRRLWENLLRAALGEIAREPAELDDLFIRHTYLSLVIGMAVQASFGIDLRQVAETDPSDLLQGRRFRDATGLSGIIESDFFAWPDEVGGQDVIRALARRIARFDWTNAPPDIAAILYETVIPPEERRTLGEYYTPAWLARTMVRELVDDPLSQRVLDPACGSGTFIAEAVGHFLEATGIFYRDEGDKRDRQDIVFDSGRLDPKELLDRLRVAVTGIDVHPVAVHLARAAWALAARPAIEAAVRAGYDASGSVPVYLGDALQLRFRAGDMFAGQQVTIQVDEAPAGAVVGGDGAAGAGLAGAGAGAGLAGAGTGLKPAPTELVFPISLVDRADTFDSLMSQVAADIELGGSNAGYDPLIALDDHGIVEANERATLADTIATLQRLHDEGRDHIWAYYTRNLVRPVALSRTKVDVVIGNPPWNAYRFTASILREELEQQSKNLYGIWSGGKNAPNQDIAGLFFARSVDLYLRDGGVIGMVLPHSALQSGQYTKWRTGVWESRSVGRGRNRVAGRTLAVNFERKPAWDLERLDPNTFFPIASCVVFAERVGENTSGTALFGSVEQWLGQAGADDVQRVSSRITDTSGSGDSPYADYSRKGADIYPRCLFFVNETENTAVVQAGQTVTVNPRRGSQDKAPWRDLDLTAITEQTIERRHLHDVHLGETVVPYATLEPLQAILPLRRGELQLPTDVTGPGGVRLGGLERRMRGRWQTISSVWGENKRPANRLSLVENLDYLHKLSSQLSWQQDAGSRPVRMVYTGYGQPTAALIDDSNVIVDYKLFWITCKDMQEANYLLAIINSQTLYDAVTPLMSKGQFGARDLQKQLWKLPIPEFDGANPLHREIAEAGAAAALGASGRLAELRAERGERLTVTIARRELRAWLRGSAEGAAVEGVVGALLG